MISETLAGTDRWFTSQYLEIVAAHYDERTQQISVDFGDGDRSMVAAARLVRREPFALDWPHLTINEHFYLHIPALPGAPRDDADIPGFDIRALTDAAFAAHLARKAEDAARRVGKRVRELREARGLSAKEVAERAGIVPLTMSRLELGRHDVGFATLQKILAAMGYSLRALLEDEPDESR